MAKGDYSSKWGGSKTAYEKGQKDAKENTITKITETIIDLVKIFIDSKKK